MVKLKEKEKMEENEKISHDMNVVCRLSVQYRFCCKIKCVRYFSFTVQNKKDEAKTLKLWKYAREIIWKGESCAMRYITQKIKNKKKMNIRNKYWVTCSIWSFTKWKERKNSHRLNIETICSVFALLRSSNWSDGVLYSSCRDILFYVSVYV